jgi:hypothetical protein
MFNNKNIPWSDIGQVGFSIGLWYFTIFPFNGTYTMNEINMNFFAIVMLFTIVFAHVLNMVEDHRLALLASLGGILELLAWERMMEFTIGATVILLFMIIIFLVSYKNYPRPI